MIFFKNFIAQFIFFFSRLQCVSASVIENNVLTHAKFVMISLTIGLFYFDFLGLLIHLYHCAELSIF
jgi:hypothetical protein